MENEIAKALNASLSQSFRIILRTEKPQRDSARSVFRYFCARYLSEYDDVYLEDAGFSVGCLKRGLIWCGNDADRLKQIIDFVFSNWQFVREKNPWMESERCDVRLFGNTGLMTWLLSTVK